MIIKKSETSSGDLVHQHNEALSSDVVERNFYRGKMLLMSLAKLHFQLKVIKYTITISMC